MSLDSHLEATLIAMVIYIFENTCCARFVNFYAPIHLENFVCFFFLGGGGWSASNRNTIFNECFRFFDADKLIVIFIFFQYREVIVIAFRLIS